MSRMIELSCQSGYKTFQPALTGFSSEEDKLTFDEYKAQMEQGLPEGLTVERHGQTFSHRSGVVRWTHYKLPELGAPRMYDKNLSLQDGLVLQIGNRRFLVQVERNEREWNGCPDGATFTFTETEDLETPFTVFSEQEERANQIRLLEKDIAFFENPNPDELPHLRTYSMAESEARLQHLRDELADHLNEETRYFGHSFVVAFGQPRFIQSPVFPLGPKGECAFHLLTVNSDWGDAGNENYMVTLDDEGYPNAVYFEASCH